MAALTTPSRPAVPVRARRPFVAGAAAAAPLVVGLIPFALLVGTAVAGSADIAAAWSGTLLIYSGSAQLALLQLLHDGATAWSAVLAAVLINLRLAVLSASLAPLWLGTPWRWRLFAAATVVEPTWAVAEQRRRESDGSPEDEVAARRHYAGAAVAVTVGWLAAVTAGALLGRADGLVPYLAVALPLCLVVMVVPHLRLPGGVAAVLAAAGTTVVARQVLPGLEILLAMAAAAVAGGLARRRRP
jgi:predicted branched-subunit amino acid permease